MCDAKSTPGSDEQLTHLLRHCGKILYYHSDPGMQQSAVLQMLRHGPLTQRQIQDRLGTRAGSVSELISKLETKGFLVRERSEDDRRKMLLTLTGKGEKVAQHHSERPKSDLFAALTDAERLELALLLKKLIGPEAHGKDKQEGGADEP